MLDAPIFAQGTGFTAHIRSQARGEYSYTEAAVVQIGDNKLEVGSFGKYFLNSIEAADIDESTNLTGYKITHTFISKINQELEIQLGGTAIVHLKTHKDLVSITYRDLT